MKRFKINGVEKYFNSLQDLWVLFRKYDIIITGEITLNTEIDCEPTDILMLFDYKDPWGIDNWNNIFEEYPLWIYNLVNVDIE
jgi:hypothetical protein